MTTTEVSRMDVNAAIEKLIAQTEDSEDAARIVIRYGDRLKSSSAIQIEKGTSSKPSDSFTGYAPGQGNVTIKDEQEQEQQEFVFGIYKDRVGHYRLWKESDGLLCFHYFWKSGLTTRGPWDSGPDTYRLRYDPKTLEPRYLAIERRRIIFQLGRFMLFRSYLEPLLGTVDKTGIGFGICF